MCSGAGPPLMRLICRGTQDKKSLLPGTLSFMVRRADRKRTSKSPNANANPALSSPANISREVTRPEFSGTRYIGPSPPIARG